MSSSDNEEKEFSPVTFTTRSNELDVVDSGDFGCIPYCKNLTFHRDPKKSGIGFFSDAVENLATPPLP